MSRKKRELEREIEREQLEADQAKESEKSNSTDKKRSFWKGLGGIEKIGIVGLCLLLAAGVMGSSIGDSIINTVTGTDSKNSSKSESSLLSRLNPFAPAPVPSSTPQLSKELIYAGDRLLTVEDANATAVPPADLAIWRPSTGYWWVMGSTGSQQTVQGWGISTDSPQPGDYDGDGKTDFCIYREVSGGTSQWYIIYSSDATTGTIYFGSGALNDIPAPADYDGDGRTDIAVYRPGTTQGTWYATLSSDSSLMTENFGLTADIPAPADYDGDGMADVALWRNSDTNFYTKQSSDSSVITTNFTQSSTEPVSADYDGDGKADYAVRNGANWIILKSSTGLYEPTISWQQAGDQAVQNDYDGDGRVDVAVWRDSNGTWYIRNSSDLSTRTQQWGASNDIPVPAYYRR